MLSVAVAVAAGVGAVCRYVVDQIVQHRTSGDFPYGTFAINIVGSLLLGLVTGSAVHHGLDRELTVVVGAGFAGGFTTLSTWAWETIALAETGDLPAVAWNVVGSFSLGLIAAAAGFGLALL